MSTQPILRSRVAGGLAFAAVLVSALVAGCAPEPGRRAEDVGTARSAVFANGGFETGSNGSAPPSWTVGTFLNPGVTITVPQTEEGLNLSPGGTALTTIKTASTPESKSDPDLGSGATLRYPKFGKACVVVNNTTSGKNKNVNVLSQTMTVGPADVDPADGKIHIRFVVAPVLENPNHALSEQPYFFFHVTNLTKGTTLYEDFNFSAQPGVPWKSSSSIYYTDWQLVDISPDGSELADGDQVSLEIYAGGCSLGGHWGRLYVDGIGSVIPGLFVSASGPAAASSGTDITYTLQYKNGAATSASGVMVDFNTPPNTTYSGIAAPGLSCTAPAPGAAGKVTCTVGSLAASAFGSFQVTVHIDPSATGSIVNGNYSIYATGVSPLLGSKVTTLLGCAADADCGPGNWCKLSAPSACTPVFPNGHPVGSDPAHVTPLLDGLCSPDAAALTCASGVCQADDDLCGYANGNGPCSAGADVCRSGVCDAGDSKCGYANDTGPCTPANAAIVCRSGVCDAGDSKCGYANDTGPCTPANAAIVCRSGVCGPDGRCGYGDNIGPCSPANGAIVCRSGVCDESTCAADLGCQLDSECAGGHYCDLTIPDCLPPAPNGAPLPQDPLHTTPVLNGVCTIDAGALVCESGVCDLGDDLCGYLNGSGPCTVADEAVVCRSGVCDSGDGKCGYSNDAGACTPANAAVVCRSGACDPGDGQCGYANDAGPCSAVDGPVVCRSGVCELLDGKCGYPNGSGACSPADAEIVCRSGACDPDGSCGYADGNGPCTAQSAAIVCRSGLCSAGGTCVAPGGCNVDADCPALEWCHIAAHKCTERIQNGGALPVDPPHESPVVDGTCTPAAGALVCVSAKCDPADDKCGLLNGTAGCDAASAEIVCRSAVCDVADGKCGYLNGHGPCDANDAAVVCRSGACSPNGAVCTPPGGCAVDADCGPAEWCHTPSSQCQSKLPNGAPVPSVEGHSPVLAGQCTPSSAAVVCASGVCDAADDKCGYANDHGPCTAADAALVCRSGRCDSAGLCAEPGACKVDLDCDVVTELCDTEAQLCAVKLPNGAALPEIAGHAPPLDGICDVEEAQVVCQSGVCDQDDRCGYGLGGGPCSADDAGVVCRSSTCSPHAGVCIPEGGCAVDADCGPVEWCNTEWHVCVSKLPNGASIPAVAGHAPELAGQCTVESGEAVCASGVCDPADDRCGYLAGTGPCDAQTGPVVCRTGECSSALVCVEPAACVVDADCDTEVAYCDTGAHACAPKLQNGAAMPIVQGHSPALDGSCSDVSAPIVCLSGVCDAADARCGHANGEGPCDAADGEVVCRSGRCALEGQNAGLCVECTGDDACAGAQAVCDLVWNECVQCTPIDPSACSGATPICAVPGDTCSPCDGDFGSGTLLACHESAAPHCFLTGPVVGECGKCATNADCQGHPSGPFCDVVSGACEEACHVDSDCSNGKVCDAGVCAPAPEPPDPPVFHYGECLVDGQCASSEYCRADGECAGKLADGQACERAGQCLSAFCNEGRCETKEPTIPVGSGLLCAARSGGSSSDGSAMIAGLLAALVLAARRRASRAVPPK